MLDCDIIRDLLPLYVDGVCSKKSSDEVRTHLDGCDGCREVYESMSADSESAAKDEAAAVKGFAARVKKGRLKVAAIVCAATLAFIAVAGWVCNVPEFGIEYDPEIVEVVEPEDGGLDLHVNCNYKMLKAVDIINDDGTRDVYVTAVRNIAGMVLPDRDLSNNFMRLTDYVEVDYQSGVVISRNVIIDGFARIARIYYLDIKDFNTLFDTFDRDSIPADSAVLIWERS